MRSLGGRRRRGNGRPGSVRYTFAYDESGIRLVRRTARTKAPRPADSPRRAALDGAVTAEVRDARGETLFRRVLANPFSQSVEFPTEGTTFRRAAIARDSGTFTFVGPDDGRAAEVVIHAGRAAELGQQAFSERRELVAERFVLARIDLSEPPPAPLLATATGITTKVVDNQPSAVGWNLVVMGDGYTAAEMSRYEDDVDYLVDGFGGLMHTAPFDAHWGSVNVYRINVESVDSGASDPDNNIFLDTYFEATFGAGSNLSRLLTVNNQTVTDLADIEVSNWDALAVVVNAGSEPATDKGGSGADPVAVYSSIAGPLVAVHELGHTAFGLADEYDYYAGCELDGPSYYAYSGSEPVEPNISELGTLDWAALVDPATPLPTSTNPDSTRCDDRTLSQLDPPVVEGTIGAFEGAGWYHSGLYRAAFTCKMRESDEAFCPVCVSVIETRLNAWLQSESDNACFVATAVYDDALHPDVCAIREFRDRRLLAGARGRTAMRLLVAVYRRVGPPLAAFVEPRPRLAGALRRALFEPWARRLRRPPAVG